MSMLKRSSRKRVVPTAHSHHTLDIQTLETQKDHERDDLSSLSEKRTAGRGFSPTFRRAFTQASNHSTLGTQK
jgi:hypothetical protein